MSIATEINDYETYLKNAYDKCEEKEATIPNKKTLQNLTSTIESIKDNVKVYKVTFDSDGGTEVAEQIIVSGQTSKEPETPTKTDYIFGGWLLNGEYFDFETPITENITLVAKWYQQQVNYQMLYDGSLGDGGESGANTCPELTGGFIANTPVASGYNEGTISFNDDHIYGVANKTSSSNIYVTSSTNNKINMTDYRKIGVIIKPTLTTPRNGTYFHVSIAEKNQLSSDLGEFYYIIRDQHLVDDESLNGSKSLASLDLSQTTLKDFYLIFMGSSIESGKKAEIMLHNAFLVKQDNWQELCTIAGLNSSDYTDEATLCADSTAISTILNSKEAVEYMIYNCTGTFMAEFVASSTALTNLNNSMYKTLIHANEHWSKFLNMVA